VQVVVSLAGFPTELGKKGAEISFFKSELPQAAHFASVLRPGSWRISDTFSQLLHLYSKIGIKSTSKYLIH
jgi:hypothetical protein